MTNTLLPVRKKVPGLFYAYTQNGVELPVLDITHPLFTANTGESNLEKMIKEIKLNGEKNAKKFQQMPSFLKKYLSKHSFVMAELVTDDRSNEFVTGLSTLMLKLGPGLIGKGKNRFFDRLASKAFGGIVLRMRVRDISRCQADAIIPLLEKMPQKNLCFINIAGGTACDSINSLILIRKENPSLLENRKIEINVLDIDAFGPDFAGRSITALKTNNGYFHDLDISFRYFQYNWNEPGKLSGVLDERKEWLTICSSEGGIFEYCSDAIIIQHLHALSGHNSGEMIMAGSMLRDINTIDPGVLLSLKISTNIQPRFLGSAGLRKIMKETGWEIDTLMENNPRYIVFILKNK